MTLILRSRANDAADRRCDIGRRQRRGGDLIQQRLKQVIVVTVDERDREVAPGQRFRGRQSAKPRTDDDDVGMAKRFHRGSA